MANIIKESLLQLHSPSAAELGRYGKAPVDYFTGVPSIVVPLTSVHAKGYELPVELRYHGGGNRPEQHPGWVGLSWSLHAGGCINRIINGMKDEMSREEYGDTKGIVPGADPGYLYHIEEVQKSNWTDDEVLQGAYATYKDYSPDEYQICAGELNASFYIVGGKEIRIVSKNESSFTLEDIVISEDTSETGYDMYPGQCAQPIRARRYKYISCFMVRDKEGNRYVFGGDDSAIEYSVVQHPNLVEYSDGTVVNSNAWRAAATANTWLLSRIEKPDGEIISFTYEKNGVPVVVRDIHHGESYRVGASPAISGLYDTASTAANIKQNLNYTFLLPSYLKRISCRLSGDYLEFVTGDTTELRYGIVESDFNLNVANLKAVLTDGPFEFADFMRNSRYRKLVGITGYGRNISLEYTDDADTRLKLLSVKFRSTDGAEDHRYEFGYDPAPQWGGMLSEMEWRSGAEAFFRKYSFVYDGLSRLMSAEYGGDEVAGAFSESYTYDRNGNLTSLHRHGLNAHGAEKATLVSVSPSYSGNRLSAIGDAVFSYDAKGRQTASSYGGNSGTSYNVLDLPLRMTLPGGISIDYAYSADGRKLMEKVSGVSAAVTRDYCGTLLYEGGALKKIFFGGGYVDMGGQSPSYHFFLCDHLGSVRAVASEDGMVEQVSHYYPFGSRFSDPRTASSSSDNRMLFTGKELGAENGLYDFSARFLDPLLGRFTTMDPLAENCPDISPYAYCAGDPVNALDPDGRNPIYSPCGVFLGTDDFGLQGNPLIMSKSKFMQGMLHAEAEKCSSKTMVSPFAVKMMLTHFKTLKDRPDYDGYVTIIEGIRWAKEHTGAKDSPTPDNTLYVDASKLDFGTISITDLRGEGVISPVDMFNEGNRKESVFNGRLRSTVYALGRINLILLNKDELTVKVVNDEAAVYDWNYGGSKIRNTALRINNFIFGIDPKIHGFNVYYYGVGKLNE